MLNNNEYNQYKYEQFRQVLFRPDTLINSLIENRIDIYQRERSNALLSLSWCCACLNRPELRPRTGHSAFSKQTIANPMSLKHAAIKAPKVHPLPHFFCGFNPPRRFQNYVSQSRVYKVVRKLVDRSESCGLFSREQRAMPNIYKNASASAIDSHVRMVDSPEIQYFVTRVNCDRVFPRQSSVVVDFPPKRNHQKKCNREVQQRASAVKDHGEPITGTFQNHFAHCPPDDCLLVHHKTMATDSSSAIYVFRYSPLGWQQ